MSWTVTIAVTVAVVGLGLFSAWRASRPARPFTPPRMAPWNFLMAACAGVLLFLVVHMLNLAGMTTGTR